MTAPPLNRRQLALGMTAAGLAFATGMGTGARAVAAPAHGLALPGTQAMLDGFQPCRFGQVHYRFVAPGAPGGKLPLLCMHASPTSSLTYAAFLPMIGTDRLAIAADTPGYGLSDRPPAPSTIADFAAAMGDLIDGMALKKIDLLGNHTSSATAVELARQRPKLIRRIVLNSALMYTPQERIANGAKKAEIASPDLDTAVAGLAERWRGIRQFRSDLSEERAWQLFWEMNRDPTHLGWGYAASYEYDFAKTLAQIRHPMLILNAKDELFEITSRARAMIPNGRILELPWTRGTFSTHAADVAAIVRGFLDG